jgi:hypothetical protein
MSWNCKTCGEHFMPWRWSYRCHRCGGDDSCWYHIDTWLELEKSLPTATYLALRALYYKDPEWGGICKPCAPAALSEAKAWIENVRAEEARKEAERAAYEVARAEELRLYAIKKAEEDAARKKLEEERMAAWLEQERKRVEAQAKANAERQRLEELAEDVEWWPYTYKGYIPINPNHGRDELSSDWFREQEDARWQLQLMAAKRGRTIIYDVELESEIREHESNERFKFSMWRAHGIAANTY